MKRRGLIIVAVAILIAIIGIPRLLVIPYLVRGLENELGSSLNSQDVEVNVQAPWGWEVFSGNVPGLEVAARDAIIDGLQIARVELKAQRVLFDTRSLWQGPELIYTLAGDVHGEILVTEDALNELLWREVDPERLLRLQVSPEGIGLKGTLNFLNMDWTLEVQGDLEVQDGRALRYVLKNFAVQETRIPSILLEVLSENYEFVIDLGVFPYPVEIQGVFPEDGQILVTFGGIQ